VADMGRAVGLKNGNDYCMDSQRIAMYDCKSFGEGSHGNKVRELVAF